MNRVSLKNDGIYELRCRKYLTQKMSARLLFDCQRNQTETSPITRMPRGNGARNQNGGAHRHTEHVRANDGTTANEKSQAETEEKVMSTAPCCVWVRLKDRHCIKTTHGESTRECKRDGHESRTCSHQNASPNARLSHHARRSSSGVFFAPTQSHIHT
jgi:hypothetical protein